MNKKLAACTLALCLLVPPFAAAAQIWCQGKISNTYVDSTGTLTIQAAWRGDYTALCNVRTNWKGIDATTCMTWLGIALMATSKQQTVNVSYNDPAVPACNTLATYVNAPPPIYLMLQYP